MDYEDRLKLYSAYAETSRKWVSVMDTKASFLTALNAGILGFLWTGAKVMSSPAVLVAGTGQAATLLALLSMVMSLWIIKPRGAIHNVFGKTASYTGNHKAISFYGYIAQHYPLVDISRFQSDLASMDSELFAQEALEQHYTVSHAVNIKATWLSRASYLLMTALILTVTALVLREYLPNGK